MAQGCYCTSGQIFKAGRLLAFKDMSERLVSQWHKTTTLYAGAQKL